MVPTPSKKTFSSELALSGHSKRMHTNNSKIYKCDLCGKFLKDEDCLRIHVKIQHIQRNSTSICKFCNVTLSSNFHLKNHIDSVHLKKQDFKCNECKASFGLEGNLKRHIKYIHELDAIKCVKCNKEFKTRYHLQNHIKRNCCKVEQREKQ